MFMVAFSLSRFASRKKNELNDTDIQESKSATNKNPLELRTAAIFGVLFVVFALVTDFVLKKFGSSGVSGMAFVVGVTDIDPFLLNLLQQKSGIEQMTIVLAILNATNSNNLLKMGYAISLGSKSMRKSLIINFSTLILAGLLLSMIFYLI